MTRSGPWTLVLLFVFATVSLSAPPSQAQLEETGAVKGMVCGDPYDCWQGLPDATVTLTRTDGVLPHQQTATTDDGGTFVFDDVPHGAYELVAERAGFEAGSADLTVNGSESARLHLEPRAVTVALRVVDGDGDGLDAFVSWYNERTSGTTEVVGGGGTIETRSGFHTLTVESSGYSRSDQWLLLDGSDVEVVMSPVPPQDAVVLGTVRDQDGAPVAGAVVEVYQYGHHDAYPSYDSGGSDDSGAPEPMPMREPYYGGSNRTTTGADGSYRIHVWSGDVELNVQKQGHAGRHAYFQIDSGEQHRHDVELPRYPDKTAHVEGRVLGADGKPLQNVHVSIWLPEYGIRECSSTGGSSGSGGGGNATSGSTGSADPDEPASDTLTYPAPEREGCAITMHADGTFEGDVTPGYAIVEAWHDHWSTCSESSSSDGSMTRTCGPEYLGYSRTLTLAADDTTELVIQMRARPAADATISGYVVDGESQTAIPGVNIQFNNEETYGWGSATTDRDGSYKVGVRGGYHRVYVHADGYLPWQGVVQVPAGGDVSLDVVLTPGQAEYGYCCYAYAEEVAVASDGAKAESAPRAASAGAGDADSADESSKVGGEGEAVEDLGGGLGPYDPQRRAEELQGSDNGAPGPAPALLVLALVGAALASRRQR